jgi:DNA adenine methylase
MFYTPLRYPGGKGKLANYVKSLMELNGLAGGDYVEPYAGGAGVAFELLMLGHASRIHINDVDPAVHSFWHSVVFHPDELSRKINDSPVNIEQWNFCKNIYSNPSDHSVLDRGFATFFLNRTNRSGILQAGVIGGKAQEGEWQLDARFPKSELIRRICAIGDRASDISLYNQDASLLVKELGTSLAANSLMYLDPPYYVKGKGLYRNFYKHEDHVEIEFALREVTIPWIVSYDNVPQIHAIYEGYRKKIYSLSYTAQAKTVGAEVMIYGPSMKYEIDRLPHKVKRVRKQNVLICTPAL